MIDGFGMPSPNLADFDGDGDLDLLTGEFLDGFTYYENVGSRAAPDLAAGRRLGVRMDLQMITPAAVDWDGDGDQDLVCGDEDGRVALLEHTGEVRDGTPVFSPPRYFRQRAENVKFGALVSPFGFDWDADGDDDLVCGNTAGHVGLIENLGASPGMTPRWAEPRLVSAAGQPIRVVAGPNGSIQGPAEAKWGYSTLSVADWDGDGLPDLVVNGIWGRPLWYRNVGTRTDPRFAEGRPIEVEWPGDTPKPAWVWWEPRGRELVTQWRTTPFATDWNGDGLCDLVMLDAEGRLALFERVLRGETLALLPGRTVFADAAGDPLKVSLGDAGRSGRRKFCLADWDRDGRTDLLLDSRNVDFLRNESRRNELQADRREADPVVFVDRGPVDGRVLAGHDTSPAVVDWDENGSPDLVVGAEDGFLYYLRNPTTP